MVGCTTLLEDELGDALLGVPPGDPPSDTLLLGVELGGEVDHSLGDALGLRELCLRPGVLRAYSQADDCSTGFGIYIGIGHVCRLMIRSL